MADGQIKIVLERDGPFREGDPIRGRAVLTSEYSIAPDGGKVSFFWRTRGYGNVECGEAIEATEGSADLEAGASYEIPFEFTAPSSPISISGELVSVDWVLAATVDAPWARDPKGERIVEIVAREDEAVVGTGYRTPPRREVVAPRRASAGSHRTQALTGVCLLGVVALFAIFQITAGVPLYFELVLLGFVLWIVGKLIVPFVRNAVARTKIGVPAVDLAASASLGARLPIAVSLTPSSAIRVDEVVATLVCTESARKGSGKNTSTKTRIAHSERVVLMTGEDVAADATASWSGALAVPLAMNPSFAGGGSNSITWQVLARVGIPGWPDDEEAYEVKIEP